MALIEANTREDSPVPAARATETGIGSRFDHKRLAKQEENGAAIRLVTTCVEKSGERLAW
jgi:hypothetical protein